LKELSKGDHGFHIHVKGSQGYGKECQKAGPHYNPNHKVHGGPKSLLRHVGDLGNVRVNGNGIAKGTKTIKGVKNLKELRGRSVIIHAKPDDLGRGRGDEKKESEKTGNAGKRLACGILKWAS
jgi:Cu-Zn family superoxide dismutase